MSPEKSCCIPFNSVCGWFTVTGPANQSQKIWVYITWNNWLLLNMMTSSNGNIFRVTGPLCWNPSVTGGFPSQRPMTRSFDIFFDLRLEKTVEQDNRDVGDLRRLRTHHDVTVMPQLSANHVIYMYCTCDVLHITCIYKGKKGQLKCILIKSWY